MADSDFLDEDASPVPPGAGSALTITRRALMGGAGAALLASGVPAIADGGGLTVSQDQPGGAVTVRLDALPPWRLSPFDYGDEATLALPPQDQSPTGRRIVVQGAAWPGGPEHGLEFRLRLVRGAWRLQLDEQGWLCAGPGFDEVALAPFLAGGADAGPSVALSRARARALLRSAFGQSLRPVAEVTLRLVLGNRWLLVGAKPFPVLSGRLACHRLQVRREPPAEGLLAGAMDGGASRSTLIAEGTPAQVPLEVALGGRCGSPRLVLQATDPSGAVAVVRQWGRPSETVEGMSFAFKAWVEQDGVREGPFAVSKGAFWEARHGGRTVERIVGEIAERDFAVATRFSGFGARGQGPARAGQLSGMAQDGVGTAFEARCLVTHATLALPNVAGGASDNPAARASVGSRLDFDSPVVAFALPGCADDARSARVLLGRAAATPGWDASPIQLPLDHARLRVTRAEDLLSLRFRFKDLVLQVRAGEARLSPKDRSCAASTGPDGMAVDTRPLLVVDFHPQHVMERAYYRQVDPDLPGPKLPCPGAVDDITNAPAGDRAKLRQALQDRLTGAAAPPTDPCWVGFEPSAEFKDFASFLGRVAAGTLPPNTVTERLGPGGIELAARWRALPPDQQVYLGPEPRLLDPDASAIAFAMRRAGQRQALAAAALPGNADEADEAIIGRLPDVALAAPVREAIGRGVDAAAPAQPADARAAALRAATEAEKRRRDADYASFAQRYEALVAACNGATASVDIGGTAYACPAPPAGGVPADMQAYQGREWYVGTTGASRPPDQRAFLRAAMASIFSVLDAEDDGLERFASVTQARLAGASRLAFRVNCDDGYPGKARGAIPFSLEGLTDWSSFDLAVARRAEAAFTEPGGRLPPRGWRTRERDQAAVLAYQGIGPGSDAGARFEQIRRSLVEPGPYETAIEIPARLLLSPSQEARFRLPRLTPRGVFDGTGSGATPIQLWSAALEQDGAAPDVRAIWSPDLRPGALRGGAEPPTRGPWAPWSPEGGAGRERFRTGLDAYDRHELVLLSGTYGLPVLGRRDLGGTLTDASQIEPPKGYGLAGLEAAPLDQGGRTDQSAVYLPQPLYVPELTLTALGGSLDLETAFTPPAAARDEAHRTLFPSLSIERWRQRAVLGRDVLVEVVYKGFLFPVGIRATLVKVTERRFYPHPRGGYPTAYLIQRMFLRIGRPDKRFPAIGQPDAGRGFPCETIHFVTQRTPDLVDPLPNGAKEESFAFPPGAPADQQGTLTVGSNGHIAVGGAASAPGLMFWPRLTRGRAGDVPFQVTLDGDSGAVSAPLVFVDNVAANEPAAIELLTAYYNQLDVRVAAPSGDVASPARRTIDHHGTPRRYAPERKPGDTTQQTLSWVLSAEGRRGALPPRAGATPAAGGNSDFGLDAAMEGDEQPPFYPVLAAARIRLGAAERFVGRELPAAWVKLDGDYVANGLIGGDGRLENYLVLDAPVPLDMGDAGNRSGGLARPAMRVRGLSRATGIVGDPPTAPAPPAVAGGGPLPVAAAPPTIRFDPASFISADYKLLGIVSFKDLLTKSPLQQGDAPKLAEAVEYGVATTGDALGEVATIVRSDVIGPLREATRSIRKQWDDAAAQVSAKTGTEVDLKTLYAGVQAGLDDLNTVLDAAAGTADNAAFLLELAPIYESGRRFVAELDRIAEDPIGPLREDAREKLRAAGTAVAALVEKLRQGWRTQLRDAARTAAGRVIDRAFDVGTEGAALGDLLISLPLVGPAIGTYAPKVQGALSAFAKAVAVKEVLAPGAPLKDELDALSAAVATIRKSAEDDGEHQAAVAIDGLRSEVGRRVALGAGELAGPLYDSLLAPGTGLVPRLQSAGAGIEGQLGLAGLDALDKVGSAVADGFAVLDEASAAADVLRDEATFCKDATERLFEFVRGLADPQPVEDFASSLEKLDKARSVQATRPLIGPLRRAASDYRLAYEAAKGKIADGAKACATAADFPAQAIAALLRARGEALEPMFKVAAALRGDLSALAAPVPPAPAAGPGGPSPAPPGAPAAPAAPSPAAIADFADAAKALTGALRRAAGLTARPPQWIAGTRTEIVVIRAKLAAKPYRDGLAHSLLSPAEDALGVLQSAAIAAIGALDQADAIISRAALTLDDLSGALAGLEALAVDQVVAGVVAPALRSAIATAEPAVVRLFGFAASARAALGDLLHAALLEVVQPAAALLSSLYGAAMAARLSIVAGASGGTPVRVILGDRLAALLTVPLPGGAAAAAPDFDHDYLATEAATLARMGALPPTGTDLERLAAAEALASAWRSGPPAIALFGRRIERAVAALLRGDVAAFLDVQAARREVEALIKRLVPSRVRRSYDFRIETEGLPDLLSFKPKPKGAIVIAATGEIDLLDPNVQPRFAVEGTVDPFTVKLLPAFDVATLHFKAATFSAGTGRASAFKIDIATVELGEKVKFLQQLQQYIGAPKDGSGFYVQASTRRLGLVAGYKLALPPFNIGNLGFSNVSLNCACDLPFGDADAQFIISVGRADAPVLIAAAPYAGTGYIGLIANAHGIVGFEASLEYGGGGVFSFGPLTGEGRVTAGIFIRNVEGFTSLYGLFYAGGSARIACFSTSSSFCLRLGQNARGDLVGSAVYTFSFSLGFVDVSFAITVWKTESSGNGQQARSDGLRRTRYASLEAPVGTASDAAPARLGWEEAAAPVEPGSHAAPPTIVLANSAVCQSEHWGRYASYFDFPEDVEIVA